MALDRQPIFINQDWWYLDTDTLGLVYVARKFDDGEHLLVMRGSQREFIEHASAKAKSWIPITDIDKYLARAAQELEWAKGIRKSKLEESSRYAYHGESAPGTREERPGDRPDRH